MEAGDRVRQDRQDLKQQWTFISELSESVVFTQSCSPNSNCQSAMSDKEIFYAA